MMPTKKIPRRFLIVNTCLQHFRVSINDIRDDGRHPAVVQCRVCIAHLLHKYAGMSYPTIAQEIFHKRFHSATYSAAGRWNLIPVKDRRYLIDWLCLSEDGLGGALAEKARVELANDLSREKRKEAA